MQDVPRYGRELGCTNYLGVGGAYGKVQDGDPNPFHRPLAPYTGIYYANSWTRCADITDGLSHTLAFGEAMGGLHNDGTRDVKLSWLGTGWLATRWALAPSTGGSLWQFQSRHDGVVNFAFADGSVRGISRTADYWAYIAASGMADGGVPSDDF